MSTDLLIIILIVGLSLVYLTSLGLKKIGFGANKKSDGCGDDGCSSCPQSKS